uniref:VPS9 domain-containing protein n=1 Tax=Phytophthora ramorum TaxID=164328 RepID=H3GSK0_PHYRM
MATPKRRQSIEVFRLRLRETLNEGGDDGESVASSSLQSLPEQEPLTPRPEPKQRREQPGRANKPVARQHTRRLVRMDVNIDEDGDEEFAVGQEIKIDDDSDDDDEIDGREPSERLRPCLVASSSSGDDGSSRTMRCSLDAADARAIEAVAQLDERVDTSEQNEEPLDKAAVQTRSKSPSVAQDNDSIRESRRVVLVTRPSQRDIEMWTERATSTMVKSTESNARPTPTSAQSRRWVLEYKPVVRHSGWLIKRGHGLRNFKRRLFCIVDNELIYHDTHDATEVRGRLDLTRRSSVQCMLHSGFKFAQGNYSMVLYAMDNHDRDVWIRKLQEHNVQLLPEGAKTAKLMKQHSDNADKGGPVLFSGWLRKRGRMVKSTKRRWFELSNGTLSYFSHPQGGSRKGSIDVSHARVSSVDTLKTGESHSFQICTPSRNLFLHADSQEERSLWLAALASVGAGSSNTMHSGATPSKPDANDFAMPTSASELGRMCKCGAMDEGGAGAAIDGVCRRCMSSFISNTEDAMVDVTREVQLLLASPYSPEGCTSAAFLKEHTNRPVSNATVREFMTGLSDYLVHTRLKELLMLAGVAQPDSSDSDSDDDGAKENAKANAAHRQDAAVVSEITNNVQTIVHEQIEERVLFPLYRAILTNVRAQTREDSKVLKGKIEILRSKSQAFFGIGPDSVSSSKWFSACAKLREVDKVSLPYMKRAQLLAACKEIYAVFHTEHPTQPPMSADAFIPAFIYVLIHSHLRDPVALKELITFFDSGSQQGEIAYFATCLEIALEYIRSLLTACTVVLSSSRKLGIEFSKHPDADVVVVHRLVPGEQAQQSGAINVGDVLVAVNGLPVYEMELADVVKLWRGVDGEAEFCFLPMNEYVRKYGTS